MKRIKNTSVTTTLQDTQAPSNRRLSHLELPLLTTVATITTILSFHFLVALLVAAPSNSPLVSGIPL